MVSGGSLRQTSGDSLFEEGKVLVIFVIETFFANKFPEPFDQIEIGGVSRESAGSWIGLLAFLVSFSFLSYYKKLTL